MRFFADAALRSLTFTKKTCNFSFCRSEKVPSRPDASRPMLRRRPPLCRPNVRFKSYVRRKNLDAPPRRLHFDPLILQRYPEVTHPGSKQAVVLDLLNVKPFSPEYGLLPPGHREYVERRELVKVLMERQRKEMQRGLEVEFNAEQFEPDEKLVNKFIGEILVKRRKYTDRPPSDEWIRQVVQKAKERAVKVQRVNLYKTTNTLPLSFLQQYRRKEEWGSLLQCQTDIVKNVLKPMTPKHRIRYNARRDIRNPPKPRNISIEHLLAAGVHLGHNKALCHPAMKSFVTGIHDNTHIINLDYTIAHLRRACTIIREVNFRGGIILFIGTRRGQRPMLIAAAERMGGYLISRRWIAGTITNGLNVLYRGETKAEGIPFRQYVETLQQRKMQETLWTGRSMDRFVFDWNQKEWVSGNEEAVPEFRDWKGELRVPQTVPAVYGGSSDASSPDPPPSSVPFATSVTMQSNTGVPPDLSPKAHERNAIQPWMAWNKFATIVGSLSSTAIAQLAEPERLLPPFLTEYIPDHGDDWYQRQLEAENAEIRRKQALESQTGDRSPLEMFAMDKFLARKGYAGSVRGQSVSETVKVLKEEGLQAYDHVKVFRDGSTLVGKRRFDRFGNGLTQFSDGSYLLDSKVFDWEGKRYNPSKNAYEFSDGSVLKFLGQGDKRKLVVIIKDKAYDVTSTVDGSLRKREILEKAMDLMLKSGEEQIYREPRELEDVHRILGGSLQDIKFTPSVPVSSEANTDINADNIENEDNENNEGEEGEDGEDGEIGMRGSEMLELSDKIEARSVEETVMESNRLTDMQEDLQNVEEMEPERETPFDNMYGGEKTIVRPDLIVLLNPRENHLALREARSNQIPTVGIIDTDSDPRWVTYAIPANDDSIRGMEYLVGVLSRAGEEGLIHRRRYTQQILYLNRRASNLLTEAWVDYDVMKGEDEDVATKDEERSRSAVTAKYCEWYGLDPAMVNNDTITKLVSQHIIMAQNELKRLAADTTGWSMQDYLDHTKTSGNMPGVPEHVLEEQARKKLSESRTAWAMARHMMDSRFERMPGQTDSTTSVAA
jgi:ribosomal protein S2